MASEILSQNHFDTALFIYNPKNPHSKDKTVEALTNLSPLIPYVAMVASESELGENLSIINDQTKGENNLIVAVGGDGLANDIVSAMMESPSEHTNSSTFVPLRFGHANDISRSLFSNRTRDDIETIVKTGTIENIHPLISIIRTPNGTHSYKKIALGYLSIGSSSEIAHSINQPEYRAKRDSKTRLRQYIADILMTNKVVRNRQEYRITRGEESLVVTDYWIINGSWIGGVVPVSGIEITNNEAARIVTKPREFYKNARKAAMGNIELVDSNFNDNIVIESFHPIHIQYDGNTEEIISGSSVDFSISKTPIQTIATRKPDNGKK